MAKEQSASRHHEGLTVFQKDILNRLFQIEAFKLGERFKVSGEETNVYVDMGDVQRYPKLLRGVTYLFLDKLTANHVHFDVITGVPETGKPFATALSLETEIGTITVRKPKTHGIIREVDGALLTDPQNKPKVLLVDNVISEGTSKVAIIQKLRGLGYAVEDILVFVDREEGGEKVINSLGCRLHSVVTLKQVIEYGQKLGKLEPRQAVVKTD